MIKKWFNSIFKTESEDYLVSANPEIVDKSDEKVLEEELRVSINPPNLPDIDKSKQVVSEDLFKALEKSKDLYNYTNERLLKIHQEGIEYTGISQGYGVYSSVHKAVISADTEVLTKALLRGYRLDTTMVEKLYRYIREIIRCTKEQTDNSSYQKGKYSGMLKVLDIYGISVKGVNMPPQDSGKEEFILFSKKYKDNEFNQSIKGILQKAEDSGFSKEEILKLPRIYEVVKGKPGIFKEESEKLSIFSKKDREVISKASYLDIAGVYYGSCKFLEQEVKEMHSQITEKYLSERKTEGDDSKAELFLKGEMHGIEETLELLGNYSRYFEYFYGRNQSEKI